ncbi:hypothetical protein, partial [Rhizobium sp. SEMIA 4085]|uniref:hypothetical protein n=1 Tax=Rhizobium sp. SEMIA 4085 TaxID=2137761 RepID=UPI001AED7664
SELSIVFSLASKRYTLKATAQWPAGAVSCVKENDAPPAAAGVLEKAGSIAAAHAALPRPEGAGRHVGQKRWGTS